MRAVKLTLAALLAAGATSAAFAQEMKVSERLSGTTVAFDLGGTYSNVTLTVTGPDDYYLSAVSNRGAPTLDLRKGGTLSDGLYTYQLSGATTQAKKVVREHFDNGRDSDAKPVVGAAASGSFLVQNGSIVKPDTAPEPERR